MYDGWAALGGAHARLTVPPNLGMRTMNSCLNLTIGTSARAGAHSPRTLFGWSGGLKCLLVSHLGGSLIKIQVVGVLHFYFYLLYRFHAVRSPHQHISARHLDWPFSELQWRKLVNQDADGFTDERVVEG